VAAILGPREHQYDSYIYGAGHGGYGEGAGGRGDVIPLLYFVVLLKCNYGKDDCD